MRLFQKSLLHTGYFILKDGSIHPAFSMDLIGESLRKFGPGEVTHIYGTNEDRISSICKEIKEYKAKYGVLPRGLMDELRTGFSNSVGLHQSKKCYFFK